MNIYLYICIIMIALDMYCWYREKIVHEQRGKLLDEISLITKNEIENKKMDKLLDRYDWLMTYSFNKMMWEHGRSVWTLKDLEDNYYSA